MPQRKNTREPRMLSITTAFDHQSRVLAPFEGIEPESQSCASQRVSRNADCATLDGAFLSANRVEVKDYSVSQEWHKPYVEAFLETDGTKLAALFAEAERIIVGRFVVSSVETDELVDLQSAAYALTQLKKACVFVDMPQHLVA
jgi:hypothetical protein